MANKRTAAPRRRAQRGGFIIIFAMLLSGVLLGSFLALDVAQAVSRQSELRNLADAMALAAAKALDGTAAGVQNAANAAAQAALVNRYGYGQHSVASAGAVASALSFSSDASAPSSDWLGLAGASAAPATLSYVRVDTGALNTALGGVLAPIMALALTRLGEGDGVGPARAMAGRSSVNITPLALCAMSNAAAASLAHSAGPERVEYGFRRGVAYNLLALNPNGATAVSYLVNPIDGMAQPARQVNVTAAVLNAFMCTGTLAMPRLPASVHVVPSGAPPFAYSTQLNARFDVFTGTGACSALTAPPDRNIREFLPTLTGWWSAASAPLGASASSTNTAPLQTVADLAAVAGMGVLAGSYGPLWAFGPPVRFDTGAAFATTDWASLYPVSSGAAPVVGSGLYPSSPLTPYSRPSGAFFSAASRAYVAQRRVLNLPLLSCPVTLELAPVLAVGRFLLTTKASSSAITGEFIGLLPATAQTGPVGLLQ